jgi:maltodextrin utilization protein YvdJ
MSYERYDRSMTITEFIQNRLDSVYSELEQTQAENDTFTNGYLEGVIDAYEVVLNHLNRGK